MVLELALRQMRFFDLKWINFFHIQIICLFCTMKLFIRFWTEKKTYKIKQLPKKKVQMCVYFLFLWGNYLFFSYGLRELYCTLRKNSCYPEWISLFCWTFNVSIDFFLHMCVLVQYKMADFQNYFFTLFRKKKPSAILNFFGCTLSVWSRYPLVNTV